MAEASANQMMAAAATLGLKLHLLNASAESDFDAVFAKLRQLQASALVISAGTAIFAGRSARLGALATEHGVPAVGANFAFVRGGGLMSYGADIIEAYRLTGVLMRLHWNPRVAQPFNGEAAPGNCHFHAGQAAENLTFAAFPAALDELDE